MAEGGEAASKNSVVSAAANVCLFGTGCLGVYSSLERPILASAFGIYALKGLCGTLNHVVEHDVLKMVKVRTNQLATHFGIPLVACEMTRQDCVPLLPTVAEYFLMPVVDLVGQEMEWDLDPRLMVVSHGHALGATGACISHGNSAPGKLAFMHAFVAALLTERTFPAEVNTAVLAVPEEVNTAILAVACLLTWATITGNLPF